MQVYSAPYFWKNGNCRSRICFKNKISLKEISNMVGNDCASTHAQILNNLA